MKLPPAWSAAWAGLAPREKILAGAAAAVVLVALVWWIAIGPALAVLRNSDEQHRALDSQVAHMRALQQQAQALQSQPKQNHDDHQRPGEEREERAVVAVVLDRDRVVALPLPEGDHADQQHALDEEEHRKRQPQDDVEEVVGVVGLL